MNVLNGITVTALGIIRKKKKSGGPMFDAVVSDAHQTVKEDVISFQKENGTSNGIP